MYRVLAVVALNYDLNQLKALPAWEETSGFTLAASAQDGQHALELLRTNHFDLVITEISIPLMDGLQLLRHIREEELCPIVVILSNTVEFQYVRQCMIYGAFDYIQKMPGADTMLELFQRAASQLKRLGANASPAGIDAFGDTSEFQTYEDAIVREILAQDDRALEDFRNAMNLIDQVNQEYSVKGDILARKLFRNIVNRVFEQMDWLRLYAKVSAFQQLDYLWMDHRIHSEEAYAHKLEQLLRLIQNLCPNTKDATIQKVVLYVLHHPEENLQLKQLAFDMFTNYSYLSDSFSTQTGINYSDFVTRIKMARTAFLLQYTDTYVGEISERLGYRDVDYFSRRFKREYGSTPKAFREANTPQVDYFIL